VIIIDTALEKRHEEGNPVRVGLVGAGYMGRGIALQIVGSMPGMRLVAISNRTLGTAERAFHDAGQVEVVRVDSVSELESAISRGRQAVTEDAMLLCEAGGIDVIIEATGEVEFGAGVALAAIQNGKHLVLMNAELDALVGPLLKVYADRAGVVYSNTDGDQPGEVMNLYRFVKGIGCIPVLAGNIKGMLDPYRTPETQKSFAEANRQGVKMVTSFADGTKLSMEQAVIANATGFRVGQRGMYGPACSHATEATALFPLDELMNGGLVDYILGAEPGPGVFVLAYDENPVRQQYMHYFKMGDGPLYAFYTPYHLPHIEAPLTAARAVLFGDAAIAPRGAPVCDVLTVAKRDLRKGDVIDGIGGFDCFGTIDNTEVVMEEDLLPMSLSEGCRLIRDVARDQPITYADVEVPGQRLCDRLRQEQTEVYYPELTAGNTPEGRPHRRTA
jgi:predicted homoserine dehydrogenase-like protein